MKVPPKNDPLILADPYASTFERRPLSEVSQGGFLHVGYPHVGIRTMARLASDR